MCFVEIKLVNVIIPTMVGTSCDNAIIPAKPGQVVIIGIQKSGKHPANQSPPIHHWYDSDCWKSKRELLKLEQE